jgi:TonB family protein
MGMAITDLGLSVLMATLAMQAAPIQPDVLIPPRWAENAGPADVEIRAPRFATLAGIAGRVRLDCRVTIMGTAEDCRVVNAEPQGLGFDRSALAQTSDLRFAPASRGGQAVAARVTFALSFPVDGWPDQVDVSAWRRPSDEALEPMRPIAKALVQMGEAREGAWQVDPDRDAVVSGLVQDLDRELHAERVEGLALSLARSLTPVEARRILSAESPLDALAALDQVHRLAPESQNGSGRFRTMLRERYCAVYECEIANTAR